MSINDCANFDALQFSFLRAHLGAICTAGMNATNARHDGDNTLVLAGVRQADIILEECGIAHPDFSVPAGT